MGGEIGECDWTAGQLRQTKVGRQMASDGIVEPHLASARHVGQQECGEHLGD
jgi:hypothetical protein